MSVYFKKIKKVYVKSKKIRSYALTENPQKKGVCLKVYTTSPKKPNSGERKVARVSLSNGLKVTVSIPGEGHNLKQHSVVLVRGGRVRDIPGVRLKMIRNKYDLSPDLKKKKARSKYGVKKNVAIS
uniref:Small ribosomal subunit protein uS12c n=1 Tax=Acavomonas peruviana TaxID=1542312 RepID=V5KVJ0_9ALVE|nr:ribosomal protein S12 [Acavomonas peruviana]